MNNRYAVYIPFILALVFLCFLWTNKTGKDNFNVNNTQCKIDEDCSGDNFCYMGRCWGYWKGYPMPWSTCRNPYCGSTKGPSSGTTCDASPDGVGIPCLPYCKCKSVRGLGTTIQANCFPMCGNPCISNDDCPPGCPQCSHGRCSSPSKNIPIY